MRIDADSCTGSCSTFPEPDAFVTVYTNTAPAAGDYYSTINRGYSANDLGKIIWNTEPEAIAPSSGTPTTTLEVKLAVSSVSTGPWAY